MAEPLIEVRIRRAENAKAVHFCAWPATDLDSLISIIKRWGIEDDGTVELAAQFVVTDAEAYFEIVVEEGA